MEDVHHVHKIVIVGDTGTGKTCIRNRFTVNSYSDIYTPTHGLRDITSFRTFNMDDSIVTLHVCDTPSADTPTHSSMTLAYFWDADGVLILYDITQKESFDHLPDWIDQVRTNTRRCRKIILVGNKCDLTEERVVAYRTARDFAEERGITLLEVSAKDGTNVEVTFVTLAVAITY